MRPKNHPRRKLIFRLIILLTFVRITSYSQNIALSVQTGHSGAITHLVFNPSGKFVASAGKDRKVVIWETNTGKQYNSFVPGSKKITGLVFYTDSVLITSSADSCIRTWNIHTKKMLNELRLKENISSMDISITSKKLIVGTSDLCMIDMQSLKIIDFDIKAQDEFTTLRFDKKGEYIFAGGKKETFAYLLKYDAATNKLAQVRKFRTAALNATFNSENLLYYTSNDGKLISYDTEKDNKNGATTDFPGNTFNDVKTVGNTIFSCNNKGIIDVYNQQSWKKEAILADHRDKINCLALSPDGSIVASAGNDKKIILWNTSNFRLIKILQGSVKQLNVVKFTSNGESILIGYSDGTFRTSNLKTNASKSGQLTVSDIKQKMGWAYSIYDMIPISNDSVRVHFLLTHKSSYYDGVYDELEEYSGIWNLKSNSFSPDKKAVKNKDLENYISRLKKNEILTEKDVLKSGLNSAQHSNGMSKYLLDNNKIFIEDKSQTAKRRPIETEHSDMATCIALNEKYNILATCSWDGLIKFFDAQNGLELGTYGAFGKSNFIYLNKENYYFASKGALDDISFRYNNHLYAFDQFDLKFNRPDKALADLPFVNKVAITNYSKAYNKRLKKLGLTDKDLGISVALPEVSLSLPDQLITKNGSFTFKVACSDKVAKLENLHVLINGVPEYGRFGKPITGMSSSIDISLNLPAGNNYIQVYCANSKGTSSLKESFIVTSETDLKKPNLYLVTIGASEYEQKNFNLKYAAKDAKDIADYFSKSKGFNSVQTKTLLNKEVTIENVKELQSFVNQAGENDMVIVFAAGHGVLDKELDYYFATNNIDFANPSEKGIPYDIFQELLDKTKSRKKIMFLDACHSGEIDKEEVKKTEEKKMENGLTFRAAGENIESQELVNTFELSKNTFADIGLSNGASMISSAGGTEYAIEGDQWNNGVFTYTLLNGLKSNSADLNRDKKIMLSELQEYLLNEVQILTGGKQSPTSRNENLIYDYQIK